MKYAIGIIRPDRLDEVLNRHTEEEIHLVTVSGMVGGTGQRASPRPIKAQIIRLPRENTNVRSLAISLNQKRKAMLMCQDALAALEQAIQQEPVANKTPVYPR